MAVMFWENSLWKNYVGLTCLHTTIKWKCSGVDSEGVLKHCTLPLKLCF